MLSSGDLLFTFNKRGDICEVVILGKLVPCFHDAWCRVDQGLPSGLLFESQRISYEKHTPSYAKASTVNPADVSAECAHLPYQTGRHRQSGWLACW